MVFNDQISNATFWDPLSASHPSAVFFPGTNIIIYIRGSEDDQSDWWRPNTVQSSRVNFMKNRGVLVNAHFDA